METLSPAQVIAPFGKINFWPQPDGSKRVRAYILVERPFEGAKTGVAIDGSASMRPAYGFATGLRGLLSSKHAGPNLVTPEARKMCAYLARTLDVDIQTAVIYWATGSGSQSTEIIGDLTEAQANSFDFTGPKQFGGGATALLPALRYFADRFATARWGMYVFITDGFIDDIKAVKQYTTQLAQSIGAGSRPPLKLVIIGVGDQVDERQMIELDDLDTGTSVDLWDHKIAKDMGQLAEIFAEVVDETVILADNGIVRDAKGNVVREWRDTGLPALLDFSLPAGAANAFVLEFGGQVFRQPLP
jgi:hypothetical protein